MIKTNLKIWFVCLCVTLSTFNDWSATDAKSVGLEFLLNELGDASSIDFANRTRLQIWNIWTNKISFDNKKKLEAALYKFNTGEFKLAEDAFSEIISIEPSFMEAWNKRATIRYILGDFEGSLEDIGEVLLREPRHFGAISGLGLIYMAQKKYDKALKSYLRLKDIDPMNIEVRNFIPILEFYVYGEST